MTAVTRHSSKYINQNWRIKISGFTGKEKVHTLIGVKKLTDILGAELTDTLIDKASERGIDKITFKFRRGLKVTLYSK
jgi:hypothetical protein